jgi:ATP-dependent Lhr-like helicase
MSLERFHPHTRSWFTETLGAPTDAQCRGWEAIRAGQHALIAAPTGSGKTLAAFLSAIDELLVEGLAAPLPDEVRVVYVSPLKALSADVEKNLAEPLRGIEARCGDDATRITTAVRTGDTTSSARAAMLRRPPHILITTPESLYLLLTAEKSRSTLKTVRTVIVDEIHAVIGTRRGAHLALTLERLQQVATTRLQRIGLSATQKPIEHVARFLVGTGGAQPPCEIIDTGHRRAMDLAIEIPRSDLGAVMAAEVWTDYYDRLTQLINEHKTTLVFVNTRKMAERVARHLSERLGDAVTAHHGSLSKEARLDAESRLKSGQLKALVATASLELGIDIGHVDLVCQLGSPHRIATLLQRIGRSGHTIAGTPKGRLFALSLDDLVECAALLRAVRLGELDRIAAHGAPLDVLAQQIVAETACDEYGEDDLFALVGRAEPFRALAREQFDDVVKMVSEGFSTKQGRRGALVHRDEVNARVRGRRAARMLAITSGGAIPDVADYRVILEPEETFIGTLNEDFAIESNIGDIFQLGNASWQVLQVGTGIVRVADAKGAPPTIPFWLGEAPARSDELSRAVSELRADIERRLAGATGSSAAIDWLVTESGVMTDAAREIVEYLAESLQILGALPTHDTIILERFFDESGGMQLVLHAPFGSRINRAWGLALRKRFCRQFDFELQAAATEEAVLLSLGPQHSFPLADVFRYLHPATARDVLVQAFLDAPVWQTRWRWNTTISLAVPRNRGGKKVPSQLQRVMSDDLMAAVFPDAAACFENIGGDRTIPDHPLVGQAVRDCLEEAMDYEGLARVLTRIHAGEIRMVACDTVQPSPLCDEIVNARPYAFLDDAPLEERRTMAVQTGRSGQLDESAIERVRDQARPDPRDADELHDALLTAGFLVEDEVPAVLFAELVRKRRAAQCIVHSAQCTVHSGQDANCAPPSCGPGGAPTSLLAPPLRPDSSLSLGMTRGTDGADQTASSSPSARCALSNVHCAVPAVPCALVFIAAERLPELLAVHRVETDLRPPPSRVRTWTRDAAIIELLRSRLGIVGPTTARALAASLALSETDADAALIALEGEGVVLRGSFSAGVRAAGALEWCDRRLLARIHRYTLTRLRAEIEPVSAADFQRFLFDWQHVADTAKLRGVDGLREILEQLDGFEIAASAWERFVLPSRMDKYEAAMLDTLCLSGEIGWGRLSRNSALVGMTPIALFRSEHAGVWRAGSEESSEPIVLSERAQAILDVLRSRGASFARELGPDCDVASLTELVAAGLVTSDGFGGLRALVDRRAPLSLAGRWTLSPVSDDLSHDAVIETQARTLLARYGVVFRRLLTLEMNAALWRELSRVYRRLEERGEIRGGRFVSGMSGEQFALPAAVERLRELRRERSTGAITVISAADPLNLTGILTPGERIRTTPSNRIAYRNGVAVSVMEGEYLRSLSELEPDDALAAAAAVAGRRVVVAEGFVGR